jgi:energy-coupling factor transporter ATP-binding protein EcfA2
VLAPAAAGLLWALLARRASVVVAAGPSGAGKTTLLTALLDFLPTGTRRVYVRGCFEPFRFLADPAVEPRRTSLLVNEISPHLPSYLWGPGVRRLLATKRDGYVLAATAHAASVEDLVGSLAGYPLRIPPAEMAAFDLVVVLDAREEEGVVRREVVDVAALAEVRGREGVRVDRLLRRVSGTGGWSLDAPTDAPVLERFRVTTEQLGREVAERAAALVELTARRSGSEDPGGVAPALGVLGERWLPGEASG